MRNRTSTTTDVSGLKDTSNAIGTDSRTDLDTDQVNRWLFEADQRLALALEQLRARSDSSATLAASECDKALEHVGNAKHFIGGIEDDESRGDA